MPRHLEEVWLGALALLCACEVSPLPAYGNVLVQVDTDATVPALVDRLRVDIFDGSTWVSSRAFALPSAQNWPASFAVVHPGEEDRAVLVRLRAYANGTERDYLGERYVGPPLATERDDALSAEPERTLVPRLVVGGQDRTPSSEPSPNLTIDRLLRIETTYGESRTLRIALHGECFAVMADLSREETCVSANQRWTSARAGTVDDPASTTSLVGSFPFVPPPSKTPRPRTPDNDGELHDEEILVHGGAFVLGSRTLSDAGGGDASRPSQAPERIAVVGPLLVDRFEVTVGRFRAALRRGFVPSAMPLTNEGPIPTAADGGSATATCTFSEAPRPADQRREDYPLNCIGHAPARELCRFEGGDLLTEAEWERSASVAGRPDKQMYPWGGFPPTCDVVIGRGIAIHDSACIFEPKAFGPARVTAGPLDETPLGAHGLFGNVSEWVVDAPVSYASAAYRRAPLDAQKYDPAVSDRFVVRGQSWAVGARDTTTTARDAAPAAARSPAIGFRCARSAR